MIQKGEVISGGLVKELNKINNFTYDSTMSRLDKLIAKYGSIEEAVKAIDKRAKEMRATVEKPIRTRLFGENLGDYTDFKEQKQDQNRILLEQAKAYERVSKTIKLNIKNEEAAAKATAAAAKATAAAAEASAAAKAKLNAESAKELKLTEDLFNSYVQYQALLTSGAQNKQILPNSVTSLVIPDEASAMADAFAATNDEIENLDAESAAFFTAQQERLDRATRGAQLFGNALTAAFVNSMEEGANFGEIVGKMLEDIIKQLIAATLAALALSTILSALGLGGFGVAAGGSFKELLKGSMGSLTGMKLGKVSMGAMNSVSQGQNITLSGKIKGSDIILSQDRANNNRTRERGF